eukprot:TRINITY_DN4509_c0_g2_i1.p1 TRINITY_DN4509_c0_g2~~TRINITY_DN4509_c0_g2_i1.p1  ORF type:complete len:116 (+),score=2.27 TRINITY_DN4509_c0_g2_i1:79-426(+)
MASTKSLPNELKHCFFTSSLTLENPIFVSKFSGYITRYSTILVISSAKLTKECEEAKGKEQHIGVIPFYYLITLELQFLFRYSSDCPIPNFTACFQSLHAASVSPILYKQIPLFA